MGHQAIAEYFGGNLFRQESVQHGIETKVNRQLKIANSCLASLPVSFSAGVYHSWAVSPDPFPPELEITCIGSNGIIMGVKHKHLNIEGLQFHPESIMTEYGNQIIEEWLRS